MQRAIPIIATLAFLAVAALVGARLTSRSTMPIARGVLTPVAAPAGPPTSVVIIDKRYAVMSYGPTGAAPVVVSRDLRGGSLRAYRISLPARRGPITSCRLQRVSRLRYGHEVTGSATLATGTVKIVFAIATDGMVSSFTINE